MSFDFHYFGLIEKNKRLDNVKGRSWSSWTPNRRKFGLVVEWEAQSCMGFSLWFCLDWFWLFHDLYSLVTRLSLRYWLVLIFFGLTLIFSWMSQPTFIGSILWKKAFWISKISTHVARVSFNLLKAMFFLKAFEKQTAKAKTRVLAESKCQNILKLQNLKCVKKNLCCTYAIMLLHNSQCLTKFKTDTSQHVTRLQLTRSKL